MLKQYGLEIIELDLPFRLNHVNCILAEEENGWKIIDVGLHDAPTIKRWEKELAGKNITDILITHYHPDHFGYAGALQEKLGAAVSMTKIDADIGIKSWETEFLDVLSPNYLFCGIPDDVANQMVDNTRAFIPRVTPYPKVNHYFLEGELIQIGKYEYEVIFTPGHSDGLVTSIIKRIIYC